MVNRKQRLIRNAAGPYGVCLILIFASLGVACFSPSQIKESSTPQGDNSQATDIAPQQSGIANITLAYAGGAVGLGGIITLISWLLSRNADARLQLSRDRLEIDAENLRLGLVLSAMRDLRVCRKSVDANRGKDEKENQQESG